MTSDFHWCPSYDVMQLMPAGGLQVLWKDADGNRWVESLVALAVCRVTYAKYDNNGRFVCKGSHENSFPPRREVCGVVNDGAEGFNVCEETGGFEAYLNPGTTIEDYDRRTSTAEQEIACKMSSTGS